jgi:hypothetical protein
MMMVDLKKLTGRAKELVDKRGGPEGLKRDAAHLLGTLSEKAQSAAERLRESAGETEGTGQAAEAEPHESAGRAPEAEGKTEPGSGGATPGRGEPDPR